ncbi:putative transcriptional regulatory protein [Dirofilaria immitis]
MDGRENMPSICKRNVSILELVLYFIYLCLVSSWPEISMDVRMKRIINKSKKSAVEDYSRIAVEVFR